MRARMHERRLVTIVGALLAMAGLSAPVQAQKPADETVKTFETAEGFEVKLFAAEPMIENPIAIDVDTYGRVWVTEGTKYRRNVANPPDDRIKVLEDIDGDGVADRMTVFTGDLNAAMGVCVAGSRIYVPESPNLYVYEDRDNDLKPDGPRQVLLTGFGGKNHDHGTHSQVFGPDHKLYMTNGDTGYDVTGPDGRQIKYQWGAMIRCEADGTQLEDFAVNFRNPVELAVDSFGNVWCSDNDNDGLKSVRICWILEGGNYGWFGKPEDIKNPDGSFDPIHHWRADKPGFVPYVMITGFGSPCGMTFYEHDAFGPKYRNRIIHCDAGPREIRAYGPQRTAGVGYQATLENIVTNSDPYFRPVDPCVAPDGSIYVTDWYDGGVGGHAYNDPERGRIYRITPRGKKLERVGNPGPYDNDADALQALGSPNHATTFLARERLLASGARAIPALEKLTQGRDATLSARALWLLDRIGGNGRDSVRQTLSSRDPASRALAVRILRRHGDEYLSEILPLAADADGEVLKEVLLAAGKSEAPAATEVVLKAYARYDGSDRYLLETLGIASRGREDQVLKSLVNRPGAAITPRLIDIIRLLRPDDSAKFLASALTSDGLSAETARTIVAALTDARSLDAGKSLVALLAGMPRASNDVSRLALDALRRNLNGPWAALKGTPELKRALDRSMTDGGLLPAALAVIAHGGLRQFDGAIDQVLSGKTATTPEARLAAIDAVNRLTLVSQSANMVKLLDTPQPAVADAALKSLVFLRDSKSLAGILTDPKRDLELRRKAANLLMASSDGAVFLFRLIDTNKLDRPLATRLIDAAVEHPDVNVRLLFEKYIPAEQRPKTLGQSFKADEILALKGDRGRGEEVFLRSGAASCNKCHRVKGRGAEIGPDLSQIGRKYERRALLETIMNPSAGIAPEYVPYVVETGAGKVFAGFLSDQNDERIVLRTIEGVTLPIPRKDIVELVKQETSLMPELVLKSVTAQDAADLLEYLSSLQEATVFASAFRVAGPFANVRPENRAEAFGPEKTPGAFDDRAEFAVSGNRRAGWGRITAQPGASGIPEVDVRQVAAEMKGPAVNVIYIFAVTLDSAAPQQATLAIGSDDGIQVWVNGKKLHDNNATRPLVPGEDQVKVELKQGKNLILLKLDQGNGAGGLTLSAGGRANLTFGVP